MIYYLITTLHIIVCIILILVVLLQSGKGADLASAFGGGSTQTAFGSRGPASFLSKMTTIAAIVFMLTSITLSSLTRQRESQKSILETTTGTTKAPAKAPSVPVSQPQAPPPSPEQIKKMQEEIEAKQKQSGAGTQAAPSQAPAATPAPVTPADAGKSSTPPSKKP
jgi:preprotein translocase subunit SecG